MPIRDKALQEFQEEERKRQEQKEKELATLAQRGKELFRKTFGEEPHAENTWIVLGAKSPVLASSDGLFFLVAPRLGGAELHLLVECPRCQEMVPSSSAIYDFLSLGKMLAILKSNDPAKILDHLKYHHCHWLSAEEEEKEFSDPWDSLKEALTQSIQQVVEEYNCNAA